MIKEIEKKEFLENQKYYKYCFGKNQGEFRDRSFEIEISPALKLGIYSNGFSVPKLIEWNNSIYLA
ncbi:MAG: hypothetical protein E7374_01180 [Clostridiales bacterium]|nr:hypothetical protein [Clostridiales bacterium]